MKTFGSLEFLLGLWRVERRIEDHQMGVSGAFEGVATFVQLEDDGASSLERKARFHETGELHFGTYRGHSQRSLHFVQREESKVQIYFVDGRPFVDLDLRGGQSRSTHPCGLDHYEISYFVQSDDLLEEHWLVQGPGKDYEATTTLTRAD